MAHSTVGVVLAAIMLAQVVMGALIRNWLRSDKAPPKYWRQVRLTHKALGWFMLLLGLAQCVLGAELILPNGKWGILAYVVIILVAFVVGLFIDERHREHVSQPGILKFDQDEARRISMSQAVNSLTMAEVRANVVGGAKWVVLGSYVYDIGPFIRNHPGGAYLLERCIGADVSQFFFGREAFDGSVLPHAHSQRA